MSFSHSQSYLVGAMILDISEPKSVVNFCEPMESDFTFTFASAFMFCKRKTSRRTFLEDISPFRGDY